MSNVNESMNKENIPDAPVNEEAAATEAVQIPHIMFPESRMVQALTLLKDIQLTGSDNILRFAEAYKILTTEGQQINVTMN